MKKRLSQFIIGVLAFALFAGVTIDFIRYPECYISTWKYQLQCDLEAGEEIAIEYYNNTYIANGRELF